MSAELASPAPAAPAASSSASSASTSSPSSSASSASMATPASSASAPIIPSVDNGAATVASVAAANIPPPSQQDTTLTPEQQQAAQDPNAVAPQPAPTLEEIQAQAAQYQQQLEALSPYQQLNDKYGSIEAIQPVLELSDMLNGFTEANPNQAYETLHMLNPALTNQIMWAGIDRSVDTIAQDEAVREAVIKTLPNYEKFAALEAAGMEFEEPAQVDPQTKELIEQNRALQTQQAQINKSSADRHVATFDDGLGQWFKQLATETLKWGGENADLVGEVVDRAEAAFNKDQQGLNALHRGRGIALELNGLKWDEKSRGFTQVPPPDPQRRAYLENQQKATNTIIQNRLAHHLNEKSKPINQLIQRSNLGLTTARTQQEQKPVIPGSSAGSSPGGNAPDLSQMSPEQRVVWRANEARKLGRIPS